MQTRQLSFEAYGLKKECSIFLEKRQRLQMMDMGRENPAHVAYQFLMLCPHKHAAIFMHFANGEKVVAAKVDIEKYPESEMYLNKSPEKISLGLNDNAYTFPMFLSKVSSPSEKGFQAFAEGLHIEHYGIFIQTNEKTESGGTFWYVM